MGNISAFDGVKSCSSRLSDLINHKLPFKIVAQNGKFISFTPVGCRVNTKKSTHLKVST